VLQTLDDFSKDWSLNSFVASCANLVNASITKSWRKLLESNRAQWRRSMSRCVSSSTSRSDNGNLYLPCVELGVRSLSDADEFMDVPRISVKAAEIVAVSVKMLHEVI